MEANQQLAQALNTIEALHTNGVIGGFIPNGGRGGRGGRGCRKGRGGRGMVAVRTVILYNNTN